MGQFEVLAMPYLGVVPSAMGLATLSGAGPVAVRDD